MEQINVVILTSIARQSKLRYTMWILDHFVRKSAGMIRERLGMIPGQLGVVSVNVSRPTLLSCTMMATTKAAWYWLHGPRSRHCHLAIGCCTIHQRVFVNASC